MNFRKSLKDALTSANFFISVAVGVFLLFGPVAEFLWLGIINGLRLDYTYLFNTAQDSGSFIIFAPLLAALPFSARFCTELECGMIRPILLRQRPEKYLTQKFIVNGIAGGSSLALSETILALAVLILGMPYRKEDVYEGFQTICYGTPFEELQFVWGGFAFILISIGLAFLTGAIWANVGLYYGTTTVLVSTSIFGYSPMNLLLPITLDSIPLTINVIVQLLELLLVWAVFILRGRRRLQNV